MQTESNASKSRAWQRHIDAWHRSGSSQRSYCESNDLALSTFQLWRRRLLGGGQVNVGTGSECVELVAVPRGPQASGSRNGGHAAAIVLCVREYRLELTDDVQVQTLSRVIDVLESR
jgi:hypothetical protein